MVFRRSGFSLIEILLALVVLTIGIMGVLGALSFGMQANEYGSRTTKAVNIARKLMERVLVEGAWQSDGTLKPDEPDPVTSPPGVPVESGFPLLFGDLDPSDLPNYRRSITYEPAEQVYAGSSWEADRLAKITVTVWYRDKQGHWKNVSTFSYDRL